MYLFFFAIPRTPTTGFMKSTAQQTACACASLKDSLSSMRVKSLVSVSLFAAYWSGSRREKECTSHISMHLEALTQFVLAQRAMRRKEHSICCLQRKLFLEDDMIGPE